MNSLLHLYFGKWKGFLLKQFHENQNFAKSFLILGIHHPFLLAVSVDIEHIRNLIVTNQFEPALLELRLRSSDPNFLDQLDGISGGLTAWREDVMQGVLSDSDSRIVENKIRRNLLEFISTVEHQQNHPWLISEARVIIGLLSYTREDAEIFKYLQRNREKGLFSKAILADDFHFGVLSGPSGCGKTSFLQAGLYPALESKHVQIFYIKFSNEKPLLSIYNAVKKQISSSEKGLINLFEDLQKVIPTRPIVLILDQFEQFFANFRSEVDRQPFIHELKQWYDQRHNLRVKILISVRSDLLHFLYEIQESLDVELRPLQNYFNLKKFSPTQATAIFQFIATHRDIEFEESFVRQMCEEELADKNDGLISAVEIQILSLMLEGQHTTSQFSFTRNAYERFGGIEGLLQRYLREQFDAKNVHNRNQNAMKVLLALTDLDRNVRAGQLSLHELQEKLKGVVEQDKVEGILAWLESGRLVRQIEMEDLPTTYELAHGRMIIPLRNLAGKTLNHIDQLSHLLDRRVNEWLGNNKQSLYLFSLPELWKIRKYRSLISWEPKYQQKQALFQASIARWKRRSIVFASLMVSLLFTYFILGTSSGIEHRIRLWSFGNSLKNTSLKSKEEAASLLIKSHPELAFSIVQSINLNDDKFRALIRMSDSLLAKPNGPLDVNLINDLHHKALKYSKPEKNPIVDAKNLLRLFRMAGKMGLKNDALNYLNKVENTDEKFAQPNAPFLLKLVIAIGEVAEHEKDIDYLKEGKRIVDSLKLPYYKTQALCLLAQAAGNIGEKREAAVYLTESAKIAVMLEMASDSSEINYNRLAQIYSRLTQIAGEIEETKGAALYIANAIRILEKIKSNSFRDSALSNLAISAGEIAKKAKETTFLNKGAMIADSNTMKSASSRAIVFSHLAIIAGEMEKNKEAFNYLLAGASSSLINKILSPTSRVDVYGHLSIAAEKIGQKKEAITYLGKGGQVILEMDSAFDKADALKELALVAGEIGQKKEAKKFLNLAVKIAADINFVDSRVEVLQGLVNSAGEIAKKTKDLEFFVQGKGIADTIGVNSLLVQKLLVGLVKSAVEIAKVEKDDNFLEEGERIALSIDSGNEKYEAYKILTKFASQRYLWNKANNFVSRIREDEQLIGYAWILRMRKEERKGK